MKFFKHFFSLLSYMQLPKENRRLIFYSEGGNYWVHLEALIRGVLESSEVPVCYISSSSDDPGLQLKHERFFAFQTDESWMRDWLFQNFEADVVVMTMPDLDQYQVKRSRHQVHYVYVQHSLVSLQMVYREGAFDHYDTIFCAGPHHIKEMKSLINQRNLPPKSLVEHGYARLDSILEEAEKRKVLQRNTNKKHVLIAPSWGEQALIETLGFELVEVLIQAGFRVTLRPHPQTYRFAKSVIEKIIKHFDTSPYFDCELKISGQESLHASDVMISDWSGAALDYAFGLGKPVIFVDVPRKMNNPSYQEIDEEPFEVSVREKIGRVVAPDSLKSIPDYINQISTSDKIEVAPYVFNIGKSADAGVTEILKILEKY